MSTAVNETDRDELPDWVQVGARVAVIWSPSARSQFFTRPATITRITKTRIVFRTEGRDDAWFVLRRTRCRQTSRDGLYAGSIELLPADHPRVRHVAADQQLRVRRNAVRSAHEAWVVTHSSRAARPRADEVEALAKLRTATDRLTSWLLDETHDTHDDVDIARFMG